MILSKDIWRVVLVHTILCFSRSSWQRSYGRRVRSSEKDPKNPTISFRWNSQGSALGGSFPQSLSTKSQRSILHVASLARISVAQRKLCILDRNASQTRGGFVASKDWGQWSVVMAIFLIGCHPIYWLPSGIYSGCHELAIEKNLVPQHQECNNVRWRD